MLALHAPVSLAAEKGAHPPKGKRRPVWSLAQWMVVWPLVGVDELMIEKEK
jgi:hypothetical protein